MKIQINTDHNIEGDERVADFVTGVLEGDLARYAAEITRIEVHLSDENGPKPGDDDTRCMLEARLKGRKPTAVTHHGGNVQEAVAGAVDKLLSSLESQLGRSRPRR